MLKLLIAGQKATGKTREAALGHLRSVHGPLVYDAPADAGAMPARYVQNHVFDGADIPALRPFAPDRDLVTEIWFHTVAHLVEATQTPYYKKVLQPDESNFVDQSTVLRMLVGESQAQGTPPATAVSLFVFLKRAAGVSVEAFDAWRSGIFGPALGADVRVAASILNTPLAQPGGHPPFADSIPQLWFADRSLAEDFCREVLAPALADNEGGLLDGAGTFYVLADAFPVDRLRVARRQAA